MKWDGMGVGRDGMGWGGVGRDGMDDDFLTLGRSKLWSIAGSEVGTEDDRG